MEKTIHYVDIVLVEDSQEDADLVIRSLKKSNLGNNIMHLPDGEEALDFLFARGKYEDRNPAHKPRVILLDLKMPKVNGLEVLRIIKSDPNTKTIPVVIMTSSREDKDLVESYELGANAYVVKPVAFENFAKAVAELGMFWLIVNEVPK